jgi:hypothetical protein
MPSKTIPALYRSIHAYIWQRIPDDCDSRLTNLIYLMMGMFQSSSVQLPLVVRKLPLRAKKWSSVTRLSRFLNNEQVQVERWYAPFAGWLLQSVASGGRYHRQLWTLIDRQRGDLSLFRWGWDFLERCLALDDPIPPLQLPTICSVSGS